MAAQDYDQEADDALAAAGDWSKVPLVGEGMAAGNFAQARNALGHEGKDLISAVDLPEFSKGDYGKYTLAGTYDPTMADASTISEDPRLRETEMDALGKLAGGLDASSQTGAMAKKFGALNDANQLASSREGAIRMQGERSGQGGNGMDALMQAQGAQLGANRAASGTLDAVHQQALEKLANEQAMQSAAGNIRGQDFTAKNANANIINQFGMFNTNAANEAKRQNLANTQGINNANVDMGNKSLDRSDRNASNMFDAGMTKAGAQSNALQGMSTAVGQGQTAAAAANKNTTDNAKDAAAGIYKLFSGE